MWNLVHSKIVSLYEIENNYSYDDFIRLCAFSEYCNDVDKKIEKDAKARAKQKG